MVFGAVTRIITVIIGAARDVPALCARCAKTPPKACFRPYLCVFHPFWVLGLGGAKGWVHNLIVHFFTHGSSKMEVFETYFLDIVII